MNKVKWVDTNSSLILHCEGRKPITLNKDSDKYGQVSTFIRSKKKRSLVEKRILDYLFPSKQVIAKYSKGNFTVNKDVSLVYFKGQKDPVHPTIRQKLTEFYRAGIDCMPLVRFSENLMKNPSKDSRDQLFLFLLANHHAITPDGCFLAYKKVDKRNGHLYDGYTGKICNDIGKRVWMKRSAVDADRNQTCSHGLHVAAWEYAKGYNGDTLLEVKVNPMHVCAVPSDYNNQKMRVCEYIPWSLSKSPITDKFIAADKLRIKKHASQGKLRSEVLEVGKGQSITINKDKLSAVEIVALVKEKCGEEIKLGLKDKQGIVNKAVKVLKRYGFRARV